MATDASAATTGGVSARPETTTLAIVLALSFSHLLNDMMQSLMPAMFPILKDSYALSFTQIGVITLVFQGTASLLQPLIGLYTDKHPKPYSLSIGMGFTLVGLVLLSSAGSFPLLLLAAGLIGMGSSVFHPESSRMARVAAGGRPGFAQSVFQVGGNIGSSCGPLLAAFIVVPRGQGSVAWFSITAMLAMLVLFQVGRWYAKRLAAGMAPRGKRASGAPPPPPGRVTLAIVLLLLLIFSKFFYMASLGNYYTFYLIDRFGLEVRDAQLLLFLFLGAVAVGTFAGGPLGDRFGRKYVIWASVMGVVPFTLMLPYANLYWTAGFTVIIGLILASAFPAIVVYAQELMPGKVGTVSGLFFGFAFGMGGLGAAALGALADVTSIATVYKVCAFLPLIGLLAAFLPDVGAAADRRARA